MLSFYAFLRQIHDVLSMIEAESTSPPKRMQPAGDRQQLLPRTAFFIVLEGRINVCTITLSL